MWNLVPWPGTEPGPPALGAETLSHWTTRQVPPHCFLFGANCMTFHCMGVGVTALYVIGPHLWNLMDICFVWFCFCHFLVFLQVSETLETSVQFSHSVVSDSLWPHGLKHTKLSCPSPTPGACSNSCPSSQWCLPTISSSVVPFSSCPQYLPASGSFPVSQLFASGGQSIGASASVLPMNIQDWFPLGWAGWISLQSKGLSRVSSNTTVQKHQFFSSQLSL